jgi:predicted permease
MSTWLDTMARDIRFSLRRLGRNPAFTIIASLSLALGIGANTAAFGVLEAVLFRPLAVRDPGTLSVVQQRRGGTQYSMSYPAFTYLRDHAGASTDAVVAFRDIDVNVGIDNTTERLTALLVSGNYFGTLGVDVIAGSSIGPGDDVTPGGGGARGPVGLLSEQFWTRRFNRDPAIIGRAIRINGHPLTVAGIVPASFRGTQVGRLPDVYMPMMLADRVFPWSNMLSGAYNHWLRIISRQKPGVPLAQAEAEMTVAYRQFNREFILPIATSDQMRRRALEASIILEPGRAGLQEQRTKLGSPLFILMGLVALVWLIASVNVAGLMVARAERYHRDTAINLALGASSARLWQQQLVESALLGIIGVTLGLALATWMRTLLVQLVPASQQLDLALNQQVLVATLVLGLVTMLILGGLTGWQSTRRTIVRALKGEDVATRLRLRKTLIVGQLALSIVVLVAATLFSQTLRNLRTADTGFERERVLLASIAASDLTPDQRRMFYTQLLEHVRATPGVVSAALSNERPLNVTTGWSMKVRGDAVGSSEAFVKADADVAWVSHDYFKTMGIPLVSGREIDANAPPDAPIWDVLVNETFVKLYLGAHNPLGTIVMGNGTMQFHIVGVAKDSATRGFRDKPEPLLYVAIEQAGFGENLELNVRSAVPPASLAATITNVVHRDHPNVPVRDVRTIEQYIDTMIGRERTFATLSSSFGVLAMLLSAIGLYGMLAYAVSRRTKELGVRLALGASPRRLVRMVLREAVVLVAFGIALGVPLASALGGTIRTMLYGIQPGDWRSLSVAAIVLVGVATLAAWLPARRAAHVDPLIALRHE